MPDVCLWLLNQFGIGNETNKEGSTRRRSSVVTSGGRYQDSSSGGCGETSGAIRSDDDFGSLGCSYQYSEPGVLTNPPQPSYNPTCRRMDPGSAYVAFSADSPGSQTLAALNEEAVHDRQQRVRNPEGRFTTSSSRCSGTRRKVSRTCKVMNEAYFRGVDSDLRFWPCRSQMEPVQYLLPDLQGKFFYLFQRRP